MQVQRTVRLARSTPAVLLATEPRAGVVRRLYDDMCLIVGHPADLPPGAVVSCPADFGVSYRGVFYMRRATLALFWYAASGCNALSLLVGTDQAGTVIGGNKVAMAAQLSLDADLAAVFGVPVDAIHQRTFPRQNPPTAAELRQFFETLGTAKCMRLYGYPHWLALIEGHSPTSGDLDTGSPRLQEAERACGLWL
jgi:hypothetical protein